MDLPIKCTTAWQNYEVVLDVPESASGTFFGILLSGTAELVPPMGRGTWAGLCPAQMWLPVQPSINIRVAQHGLHVLAGFGEGDRFHKLGRLAVHLPREPLHYTVGAGVVRG